MADLGRRDQWITVMAAMRSAAIVSPTRCSASSTVQRGAGTHGRGVWALDQQRTTPPARRVALHPGNAVPYLVYIDAA
jgi:hypothetical protein